MRSAEEHGFKPTPGARGYVYNADAETLIRVLLFGSDPKGRGGDPKGREGDPKGPR